MYSPQPFHTYTAQTSRHFHLSFFTRRTESSIPLCPKGVEERNIIIGDALAEKRKTNRRFTFQPSHPAWRGARRMGAMKQQKAAQLLVHVSLVRSRRQGWGMALQTEFSVTRRRRPTWDSVGDPGLALPDLPTLTNLIRGGRAAPALSYRIKCPEKGLLSRRRGEDLPQPFPLPGMEVSGAEWINPNTEACYAEKAKPSFFFSLPKKVYL